MTTSIPGANPRLPIHAATGSELTARSWQTEAPLRMLMNNLDPENAERPEDLVVYGGTGKAARDWASYDALVRTLRDLRDDETMLVQSGKPVGVMRTHEWAPRVLIANSNLVGDWANWEEFRRLEDLGLTMYGQMTAGSWIYIGTQGILQGTFETFAAVADKLARRASVPEEGALAPVSKGGGTLAGTITLTAGLGGMGGAQPLAVTMNDGVAICIECDQSRIQRRIDHRYLDVQAPSLSEAVEMAVQARDEKRALSIGVLGNAAELLPALLESGAPIDIVTDQTSAHDPLFYLPVGTAFEDWEKERTEDPVGFTKRAQESMAAHVRAMVEFQDAGAEVFDYGNSIRDEARKGGYDRAFEFPGFVPAYIRPLFCEGKGPFRWAALSGDPADIAATDKAILELFPDNERLHKWITMAGERVAFQGLPARICWLGYGERHLAGLKFNEMVASGELKAPIVIGRDHLDCGSVASPYRETEAMLDGSDAIADWALLNALVNTASGATWVSIHHGGGVGIGRSIHAGQVCVADGTSLAAEKIERVLTNDPGMGVIRHVDAGYDRAVEVADERGVRVPMSEAARTSGPNLRGRTCGPNLRGPRGRTCEGRAIAGEGRLGVNLRVAGEPSGNRRPDDFERMWADLAPVGRSAASGGYFRQPFLSAERELAAWFLEACAARDLAVETDLFGNVVGWWRPAAGIVPDLRDGDTPVAGAEGQGLSRPAGVLTGSHLDSVLDGGAYDGPLGVVSALAAIDALRARGFVPDRPIGVGVFVEEEGSRFGLACLGSRLATGSISWDRARELRDRDGIALADVVGADVAE